MAHSVSNSNDFLSHFNQMDDFLTQVLNLSGHMPFSEKIDAVAHGIYSISAFVKHHSAKLKYFADMRNQIVHGFRLDHEHYLLASEHAVQAIKVLTEHMITPPTLTRLCGGTYSIITLETTIKEALTVLVEEKISLLPVYNEGVYLGTVSIEGLISCFIINSESVIATCMEKSLVSVLFLSPEVSIYGIDAYFVQTPLHQKPLTGIWITQDGTELSPIIGKITPQDLPKLHQMSILNV